VHSEKSGVCQFALPDEASCLAAVRKLVGFLPPNNLESPARRRTDDPADRSLDQIDDLVPKESNKAYDIKHIIEAMVDDGDFFEVAARFAQNIVVGFAHLDGHSVGIVANQPTVLAGV